MATTRLISLHIGKGNTIAKAISSSTDYVENPDKTRKGELITGYECDPRTADAEFLLSKKQYFALTGKVQDKKNDVIAYHLRQAFLPGEVSPEQANQLGYELALSFTKGKHQFIVATHIDKAHIHNHIIFNSTTLDCTRKFKNLFLYTKMRNVAGLSQTEAQKSSDLFGKCRYLEEITRGKGIIFATGTPNTRKR